MMNWEIKPFKRLSADELYQVLALRCEVFIVEQNCPYQDVDGKDSGALHLMGFDNGLLVAYARLFGPGAYLSESCIGRVVVKPSHRKLNLGNELMKRAMQAMDENFPKPIKIHAQSYLRKFYQSHGFRVSGDEFLEDDIPHLPMLYP